MAPKMEEPHGLGAAASGLDAFDDDDSPESGLQSLCPKAWIIGNSDGRLVVAWG
jgi:hypothetical protein